MYFILEIPSLLKLMKGKKYKKKVNLNDLREVLLFNVYITNGINKLEI